MADTALSIISDAAVELGLGAVTAAYSSTDANVIQLRTLLKSAGRDMITDHDWTFLTKEYTFVTRQNWAASTTYTASATAWATSTAYSVGDLRSANGNLYRCTTAGTSSSAGVGPNTTDSSISDGTVVWKYQNAGSASIVVKGKYYYTCSVTGTSGSTGPYRPSAGTETDGTVTWTWGGNASDYSLPSDFSNMLDQTWWNRTNRLPVVGPMSAQEWQYLKGRLTGVVFNVLFRPVANVLRLYPDTDPTGGYTIAFEYVSSSWVSATGGTVPTTNAPTADTDLIYYDGLLMVRRLKVDWLKAKGFDYSAAQQDYEDRYEQVANADNQGAVLNLRGRGTGFIPLLGANNVPITGFGS